MSFTDVSLFLKKNYYRIYFLYMNKDKAMNLLRNPVKNVENYQN